MPSSVTLFLQLVCMSRESESVLNLNDFFSSLPLYFADDQDRNPLVSHCIYAWGN